MKAVCEEHVDYTSPLLQGENKSHLFTRWSDDTKRFWSGLSPFLWIYTERSWQPQRRCFANSTFECTAYKTAKSSCSSEKVNPTRKISWSPCRVTTLGHCQNCTWKLHLPVDISCPWCVGHSPVSVFPAWNVLLLPHETTSSPMEITNTNPSKALHEFCSWCSIEWSGNGTEIKPNVFLTLFLYNPSLVWKCRVHIPPIHWMKVGMALLFSGECQFG